MWRTLGMKRTFCALHKHFKDQPGKSRLLSCVVDPDELPTGAEVVVCGGGVVGTSVAYHLSEMGCNNVVLLEQGSLGGGTTWHSAAMTISLREHPTIAGLTDYGIKLYEQFEQEGSGSGFKKCGSLNLARTESRMTFHKRCISSIRQYGRKAEMLSPSEITDMIPWIKTDDLLGGAYVPDDGSVSPTDLVNVFAKKAKENGVKIREKCSVQAVHTDGRKVTSVETNQGSIDCKYFVNAAGLWSRQLGERCQPRISAPLQACEHFYIITQPLSGIEFMTPCIRDYDGYIYFREWSGGLMCGGFEPKALPCFRDSIPDGFEFQLLPDNWEQFEILWDQIIHRAPIVEDSEIRQFVNGPESFTPDSGFLLGPAPEVENYYLATGMSSLGVVSSGGVGKAIAEWIIDGKPRLDFTDFDIRRLGKIHDNSNFLADRASEILAVYGCARPGTEITFGEGRDLRNSTLHEFLRQKGAQFSPFHMGWEQVSHFNEGSKFYKTTKVEDEFNKPVWFDAVKAEVDTTKKHAAIFDISSMTVLDIESDDSSAGQLLEKLCCTYIAQNTISKLGMLNTQGGYEAYCYVWKLNSDNRYRVMATAQQETRLKSWISKHLFSYGPVKIHDLGGQNTILQLIGPKSKYMIELLDQSNILYTEFPFGHHSSFVVFVNKEDACKVMNQLLSIEGTSLAGNDALKHLEDEIKEPSFGPELNPSITPLAWEIGARKLSWEKDFVGRDALKQELHKRCSASTQKKLLQFSVNKRLLGDKWIWGHEPVICNGIHGGWVTSHSYHFDDHQHICWAVVDTIDANDNVYQIEVACEKIDAKIIHPS